MPTGYTAPVVDGEITDVKDFAATCARAFGAFVHQRDDGLTSALRYPESPDNSYYVRALSNARTELSRWKQMSEEDKYAEWSDYVKTQTAELHRAKAESAQKRARYEDMLAQVHSVDVPSMIQNFKNFMVEQLEESIKFDCGDGRFERDYYRTESFSEWCDIRDAFLPRDVSYYEEQLSNARERHAESVRYIDTMAQTFGFEVEES